MARRLESQDQPPEPSSPTGVDRGEVISRGLRWTSSWALRTIVVLIALYLLERALAPLWVALLPLILALVISTVLWPVARWLGERGFPPALAAATSLLGALVVLGGVIVAIATSVADQSEDLANRSIGGVNKLRDWVQGPPLNIRPEQIDDGVKAITDRLRESGAQVAGGVFTGVSAAGAVIVTLLLSLVLTFFMIKDGPRFLPMLRRLTGERAGAHLTELLTRMWNTLSGFIRTQAIVSMVDAVFIGAGLLILRVPLALPLTALTFLGGFIPIVGATVAGALAVLVALVSNGFVTALIVLGIVIAVQQLEGHVLQPVLQSRSMNVHPALVLLGVTVGSATQGIIGAFLAVPVVAVLAVLLRYLGEQVDLRTGATQASDVSPATPHGEITAKAGEAAYRQHSAG
ncbi:AI-2E family transporter [Luteipulveratus sp. YIM 133132]|uniref:AI-2E family transporter n=1 Tax=Luteipulveratus flavus TaxID=3031728 RepID=UPI0023AFF975|nr:AI-2E family transporter [Luteipulveratus sp. YIM 133132]MDE9364232.1 AI-2E family transporter [Luteipulveratus sp. YIM 133132]